MRPLEMKSMMRIIAIVVCCLAIVLSGCAWLPSRRNDEEVEDPPVTIIEKPERRPAEEPVDDNDEPAPIVDQEAIKDAIEAAIDEHMRDLKARLERDQQRDRLFEMLGGVGYIIGLMGLLFFLLGLRGGDKPVEDENDEEDEG